MENEIVLKVLSVLITMFGIPLVLQLFFSFLEVLFLYQINSDIKITIAAFASFASLCFTLTFMGKNQYLLKFLKK